VKAIQVIERENKHDEVLRAKLVSQGLDPYDKNFSFGFRRYKGNDRYYKM
jgi:hypothetical protein